MVGKLLKYDLKAYLRVLVPAYLVLAAIAVLVRVIQFFEPSYEDWLAGTTSAGVYNGIFISSCVLLGLACVVVLVLTFAQVIIVFYRNLFTREGYLSFTLPVSTRQHLVAKVLGALIIDAVSAAAVFLALCVATFGEVLSEAFKAFGYLVGQFRGEVVEYFGAGHFGAWVCEGLLMVLAAAVVSYLFYYLCICIGQLARKNRVLAAFGVFFGFYILLQILTTVFVVVVSIDDTWIESLAKSFMVNMPGSAHGLLLGTFALNAVVAVVEYLICHRIITRRLNLE